MKDSINKNNEIINEANRKINTHTTTVKNIANAKAYENLYGTMDGMLGDTGFQVLSLWGIDFIKEKESLLFGDSENGAQMEALLSSDSKDNPQAENAYVNNPWILCTGVFEYVEYQEGNEHGVIIDGMED